MRNEPNYVDVHVGSRVKLRRKLVNMTQEAVAERLGLTFQQVQKYEKGTNRISGSRLYQFSLILGVKVQFFFEEMPDVEQIDKGETIETLAAQTALGEFQASPEYREMFKLLFDASKETKLLMLYVSRVIAVNGKK